MSFWNALSQTEAGVPRELAHAPALEQACSAAPLAASGKRDLGGGLWLRGSQRALARLTARSPARDGARTRRGVRAIGDALEMSCASPSSGQSLGSRLVALFPPSTPVRESPSF